MSVSENITVCRCIFHNRAYVFDNMFFVALKRKNLPVILMTAFAPRIADLHGNVRVKKVGEQKLQNTVGKNPFYKSITKTSAAQTVAVTAENFFAVQLKKPRLSPDVNPELVFQIMILPDIVVARKIMNFNALLPEFGEFCKKSVKIFRDNMLPFVPIVKNVAQKKNRLGVVLYKVEPTDNAFFPFKRDFLFRRTEMKIRREKIFLSHLKLIMHYALCIKKLF